MEKFQLGSLTISWLRGGVTHMDGGAMFGVVPRPLWSKKYPVNERNQIELRTDPLLVQWQGKNILIESGIGYGKLSDKQKRNYGVNEESEVKSSLADLSLTVDDIDIILMTHLHFDHASGLTEPVGEGYRSVFPNAVIYTSEVEWNEMKNPNIRSKNTYWKENWEAVEGQVQTFHEAMEVLPGLTMHHTGGHSDGHSIITMVENGQKLIHMADLMPTHAHANPLWVLAYDDYPMTSIYAKEKWIKEAVHDNAWFIFYHDASYRALKWNTDYEIVDEVKREK
ncbi:YtnP family quorum-quenching lactonase [Guptibacillus algicola]|uniref:YtnP family quorum-quenching lactonase n=1 Tax=Guptibacillus algicola TaxID=225844 RepID=UPI001CD29D0A|nr:MBL fold metallo-hydrolase [Alkalihalobacillus algicola]MCA0986405.1 MBL fold metallo-hydrolase [Alkalihalobacillus algicola]